MAQFGRPSADTYNADGYTDQGGGGTNIYTTIDEVSLDDGDYIRSALTPTSDVYVTKLSSVEDPQSSAGHTVRVRRSKDAAGGDTITLTAELRQGYVNEGTPGTLIATIMNAVAIDEAWTTTTYNLSGAEADAITNYADLFLRFVANRP
jgi:hypothetical protein